MPGYLACSVAVGYDPMLGRFTSPDSIVPEPGSVIGYNRYAYVNNNPMIYTDPSGHCYTSSGAYIPGGGEGDCSFRTETPTVITDPITGNPVSSDVTDPGGVASTAGWDMNPPRQRDDSVGYENRIESPTKNGKATHWWQYILPSHIGWRWQIEACVPSPYLIGPSGTYGMNFVYNFYSGQATINTDYSVTGGPGIFGGASVTTGPLVGWHSTNINDVVSGTSHNLSASTAAGGAASLSLSAPANKDLSLHVDPYFDQVPSTFYIGGGGGAGYATVGIGESFTTNNVQDVSTEVHDTWNYYMIENPNWVYYLN